MLGLAGGFLLCGLQNHPLDLNGIGDWWWGTFVNLAKVAPLGTFLTAIVAFLAYRGTLKQKRDADNRNAWWNRVQWAIDASLSNEDQTRATGMAAIVEMQDSEWATSADQNLLLVMATAVRDETVQDIEEEGQSDGDDEYPHPIGQRPSVGDNGITEGGTDEQPAARP